MLCVWGKIWPDPGLGVGGQEGMEGSLERAALAGRITDPQADRASGKWRTPDWGREEAWGVREAKQLAADWPPGSVGPPSVPVRFLHAIPAPACRLVDSGGGKRQDTQFHGENPGCAELRSERLPGVGTLPTGLVMSQGQGWLRTGT